MSVAEQREVQGELPEDWVKGALAAFLAVVVWASPSVIAKVLPLAALPIVFFRGWLGVIWATGALYVARGKLTPRVLRYSMFGGLCLGADLMAFFTSIKLTTVANATVIGALTPLALVFVAPILFKERLRWPDLLAVTLAIGGVVMVMVGSQSSSAWSLRGDLFAVLTLVAWTAYFVASKRARAHLNATEFTAGVTVWASLLVTPFVLLTGSFAWPETAHWPALVFMAICGWAGHVLMNWALGRIPIWVGGTASLAVPVFASALAAVFLSERFLPIQWVGMTVVIVCLSAVVMRTPKIFGG